MKIFAKHLALLGIALIALTQCSDSPPQLKVPADLIPGRPPILGVDLREGRMIVYPSPESDWKEILSLDMFQGFWPGITCKEARRLFGDPDSKGEGDEPFCVYKAHTGIVEIAYEHQGALLFIDTRTWTLEGYPYVKKPEFTLHLSVLENLPDRGVDMDVVVLDNQYSPVVDVLLEHGEVKVVAWRMRQDLQATDLWPDQVRARDSS